MAIIYIILIAIFSFFFSIFLVVISEEIGIWAGVVFFGAAVGLTWQLIKMSLSRY